MPAPSPGQDDEVVTDVDVGLGSLGYRLSLVARRARIGFERHLVGAGASFATWTVLETLVVHGAMIQRDLAECLEVSGQTMARHIDRMVEAGWLCRRELEGDRRAALVEVTSDGVALHGRLRIAARRASEALTRGLSTRDRATLDRLIDRLASNIARDLEAPAGEP